MKCNAILLCVMLVWACCCATDMSAQKRPLATLVERQSLRTIQYDEQDRQVGTQSFRWDAERSRWSLMSMTEEYVNELNLPDYVASIEYHEDGSIESGTQTEYAYNDDGEPTQQLTFVWNADTEQWDNYGKRVSLYSERKYGGKSVLLSDAHFVWCDSTREWVMMTNEVFCIDDSTGAVVSSRQWNRSDVGRQLVATTETEMTTEVDREVTVTYALDEVQGNKSVADTVTNGMKSPVMKQETVIDRETSMETVVTYECEAVTRDKNGEPLIIWTPNKKIITPLEKPSAKYDRLMTPATETVYEWQDESWRLAQSTSTTVMDNVSTTVTYFFEQEVTNGSKSVTTLDEENRRVDSVVSYVLLDYATDMWEEESKTEYEYDEATGRMSLEVTYARNDEQWVEESRMETAYDSDGDIAYTIRNDSLKVEYIYSQQILDIVLSTGSTAVPDPAMEGAPKSAKTLNNGRMVIIRGDKMYDLNGMEVE